MWYIHGWSDYAGACDVSPMPEPGALCEHLGTQWGWVQVVQKGPVGGCRQDRSWLRPRTHLWP